MLNLVSVRTVAPTLIAAGMLTACSAAHPDASRPQAEAQVRAFAVALGQEATGADTARVVECFTSHGFESFTRTKKPPVVTGEVPAGASAATIDTVRSCLRDIPNAVTTEQT